MIRQQLRRLLSATLVASLAFGATAVAAEENEPTITFFGGGFGHGIGMSQYGAYGRAIAGHTYDEILAHYYADTTIESVDGHVASDDVDVRVSVRSLIAISTPLGQVGSWEVEVTAGGEPIGSSTRPVTASWDGARWAATWTDPKTEITTDLCAGNSRCEGTALEFALDPGERTVLEEFEDGDNLGEYRSGKIILHPASVPTAKGLPGQCGSAAANEFCVIHGDLDFQEYLYGIAEVPSSWPDEALKAQVIAARSYTASRIVQRNAAGSWREPFDLYDSVQDQAYTGWAHWQFCDGSSWCAAVDDTDDEVVVYNGAVAETFYSASNGGYSAEPQDVWSGGTSRPYLQATPDEFDGNAANPYAAKEYVYTVADVSRWLNGYTDPVTPNGDQLHVGAVRSIEIDAPPSGRVSFATVTIRGSEKTVTVEGRKVNGSVVPGPYGFRLYSALREGCLADGGGCDALRSTNFTFRSVNAFADVDFDDYFYQAVQWMTAEELTTGVGPDQFGPHQSNSRGQIATFLWRFAGEPDPAGPSGFDDVDSEAFYADAVAWMKETDITTGTSPTRFSPAGTVTRAQAATFLWRFAGEPPATGATAFTDVPDGAFYSEAVRWMVEWQITTGTSPTTFSPTGVLTRAQIATFLWRLADRPDAFADGVELPPAMRAG